MFNLKNIALSTIKQSFSLRKPLSALVTVTGLSLAHAAPVDDLWKAVEIDNVRAIEPLAKAGVDLNVRNAKGQVPISAALQAGSFEVAKLLSSQPGLDVNAANTAGETPLMMAALRGRVDVMQTLIERGAKVHQAGWSPIHYAASGPEVKAVALLLDKGAPVDPLAGGNVTPLMMAAMYGSEASVDLLVARGANVALRTATGETAADRADKSGRDWLAKKLTPAR
jgi:uncharacterized protein